VTRDTADMPRLTPAIVADDEALAELVDLLYEHDPHLNARNTEIAIAQGSLFSPTRVGLIRHLLASTRMNVTR
jgi:hypothetical protein